MDFSTKIKGHHHLQGNVQVYNVRIPVFLCHKTGAGVDGNTWEGDFQPKALSFLALGASGLLEAPGPRAVTEKVTLATGGASGLVLIVLVREP